MEVKHINKTELEQRNHTRPLGRLSRARGCLGSHKPSGQNRQPRPKFICLRGELGAYMRHLWGAFWPRAAAAFPYLPIERLGRGVQGRRSSRAGVQRLAVEEWGRTWFFKIMHWDHRQRVAILMGGLRCTQRPCSHAPPPPPPPPPPRRARRLTPDAVFQGSKFKLSN